VAPPSGHAPRRWPTRGTALRLPAVRRTKIVATIGPSCDTPERLQTLIEAGIDVARVNYSHGNRDRHAELTARIRDVAAATGRRVAVLADLCGPKIRTGRLAGGQPVHLPDGSVIRLVPDEVEGTAACVSVSYERLSAEVGEGARILVDDGLLELRVEGVEDSAVVARVVHGGWLNERKGVNFPGVRLSIPSITDRDRADLDSAIHAGADMIALSFVRSARDCHEARHLIDARDPSVSLVAKIEKPEAVEALPEILREVDGIMVARGDLGVETSPEAVPILQKRMIADAIRAERFAITATQMLQSMVEQPRPTRAEASDVANAIFDGTDAVMLSGETAAGRFPFEAVRTMDRIVRVAEESDVVPRPASGRLAGVQSGDFARAVAEASVLAAEEIGARAIVVLTEHGSMAKAIAALRPFQRLLAFAPTDRACNALAAVWGVEAQRLDFESSADELLVAGDRAIVDRGIASPGEPVVIVTGVIESLSASTMMKLHRVGDLR